MESAIIIQSILTWLQSRPVSNLLMPSSLVYQAEKMQLQSCSQEEQLLVFI